MPTSYKLTFVPSQGMGMCSFVGGIVQFYPQCVDFCGLELSLESGAKMFLEGIFFVFQICWDEEMKILCQTSDNCYKFLFCG